MKRALLVLVLVLLALAPGATAQAPDAGGYLAYNIEERQPTTLHRFLYSMVADCLGVEDDSDAFLIIRWYVVDFILRVNDYRRMGGLWASSPHTIWLDREKWSDPHTVSHEIVHELTDGLIDDDDPAFVRCVVEDWVP